MLTKSPTVIVALVLYPEIQANLCHWHYDYLTFNKIPLDNLKAYFISSPG